MREARGGMGREGTLQQLVSIIHGGACSCVWHDGGGLRPLAPEREQQVREDEDYKNTSRQLACSYHSVEFVSGLP